MQPWPRVTIVASFLLAVAAAMYGAKLIYEPVIEPVLQVAPPFVIAVVLAFLLDPLIHRLQRHGASRDFAVAIVGLSFLVVFVLAGLFLVPKIAHQATQLAHNYSRYADDTQVAANKILQDNAALLHRLHLPVTASEWVKQFSGQIQGFGQSAITLLAGVLTAVLSKILWLVIIPLSTLWILRDLDYIKAKIMHLSPERHLDRLVSLSSAVGTVFGKYVRGMMTVAILFSAASMLVLSLAGLDYGLIIGAVAGLFYMVPYVGVAIIAIVTCLAALAQAGHGTAYAFILMGYILVQSFIVFDQIITPRIVGGSVGVHPVLALFSLALGARMFGVVGMIAAVPVAASLQVAVAQVYPRILDKVKCPPPQEKPPKESPRRNRRRRGE
jgi:predicted PurR-regulated permease PerM